MCGPPISICNLILHRHFSTLCHGQTNETSQRECIFLPDYKYDLKPISLSSANFKHGIVNFNQYDTKIPTKHFEPINTLDIIDKMHDCMFGIAHQYIDP